MEFIPPDFKVGCRSTYTTVKSCKRGLNILLFNIEQHDAYQYIDVVEIPCVDFSSQHRSTLSPGFAESS